MNGYPFCAFSRFSSAARIRRAACVLSSSSPKSVFFMTHSFSRIRLLSGNRPVLIIMKQCGSRIIQFFFARVPALYLTDFLHQSRRLVITAAVAINRCQLSHFLQRTGSLSGKYHVVHLTQLHLSQNSAFHHMV